MHRRLQRLRRDALVGLVGLASRPLRRDRADDPYHAVFADFIAAANALGDYSVLELGARGSAIDPRLQGCSRYVGIDVLPGPNVDVVGDVHHLSTLLDERFDAVYSISTFEHLAMPWQAVLEVNRVMNDGGLFFAATHHTWPPHELPWDFWRFSRAAFQVLLNPRTGFEIVRAEEGLPCLIVPMVADASVRGLHSHPSALGVSVLARKIGEPDPSLAWSLGAADVVSTMYPGARTT